MTAHKHAHLMAQYAQDALETDTPWKRWEFATSGNEWVSLPENPIWSEYSEYRRKPRTLTYTVTMPEPLREAPEVGKTFWLAEPWTESLAHEYEWVGHASAIRCINRGLCFATKEDAIAAAKAMLPIKGEEHEKPLYTAPPKRQPLTDECINEIANSMPGGLAGFMKGWGWQQFAPQSKPHTE